MLEVRQDILKLFYPNATSTSAGEEDFLRLNLCSMVRSRLPGRPDKMVRGGHPTTAGLSPFPVR
jgi:hypothetical protein